MKNKFHHADALAVAQFIYKCLAPVCERIEIAGSICRQVPQVGDAELVYVSRPGAVDMFGTPIGQDAASEVIAMMEADGILRRRLNRAGNISSWGESNKFAVYQGGAGRPPHPKPVGCGMEPFPVDLFAANAQNFISLMVCRTGPRDAVVSICQRAQAFRMHYHPYDGLRPFGAERKVIHPQTQEEFFDLLKWPCLPPSERHLLEDMVGDPL
jgi:DNA polymerase/3'-5' exonuclease PolX